MSTTWIEGYGLVHVAGGKSPVERDATIQYFIDTAPKYDNLLWRQMFYFVKILNPQGEIKKIIMGMDPGEVDTLTKRG